MEEFYRILNNNRAWVDRMTTQDPNFFGDLAKGQTPTFLFIGCADSRVPANEITGTGPGEMFVHRNIANQVFPNDMNMLSVVQYGIEALDIKHIIVCGHYGCGGVKAGCSSAHHGLVDNWLGQIRGLNTRYHNELSRLRDEETRHRRMVDLSVVLQVFNLTGTPTIREAWERGTRPKIHGLVYDLAEGLLQPLVVGIDSPEAAWPLENPWQLLEATRPLIEAR